MYVLRSYQFKRGCLGKKIAVQGTGLHSQQQEQHEEIATRNADPAWETVPSSEEDDEKDRSWALPAALPAPALTDGPGEELLTMMTLLGRTAKKRGWPVGRDLRPEGLSATD